VGGDAEDAGPTQKPLLSMAATRPPGEPPRGRFLTGDQVPHLQPRPLPARAGAAYLGDLEAQPLLCDPAPVNEPLWASSALRIEPVSTAAWVTLAQPGTRDPLVPGIQMGQGLGPCMRDGTARSWASVDQRLNGSQT
jgi:hypothetical protein